MAVVPGEVGTTFDQALSGAIQVFDLGRPLFNGASQSSYHPEFRMELQRRHGDMIREDGSSSSNELVVTGGHVGTHIDALCHVSVDGQLYGGVDAVAAATGEGFSSLGAETIAPMVCRGLLLDVPAIRGVDMCPAAYEISPEDLDDAVHLTGTTPRPGDVLLIRTGWGRHFDNRETYSGVRTGVPGPGESGARWLSARRPLAVGADTLAFECLAPDTGRLLLPAHRHLLFEEGIYIIESLDLEALAAGGAFEFVFILSPLKLVGATASPVRPLALTSSAHETRANLARRD